MFFAWKNISHFKNFKREIRAVNEKLDKQM